LIHPVSFPASAATLPAVCRCIDASLPSLMLSAGWGGKVRGKYRRQSLHGRCGGWASPRLPVGRACRLKYRHACLEGKTWSLASSLPASSGMALGR
jgi:hypothetical protein